MLDFKYKLSQPKVVENFIDPEDAQILIDEMDSPSEINPYPEYYKTRFGGTGLPYNSRVNEIVKKYAIKSCQVHQELFPEEEKQILTFKAFGCTWQPGGYGGVHVDDQDPEEFIQYSTAIYLNDGYTGGDIIFPRIAYGYSPKKYSAIFFPSDGDKWIHGVTPVASGTRSTLLLMHTTHTEHQDGFVVVDPDLN